MIRAFAKAYGRPRSASAFRAASRVLVGGVNSPVRAFRAVGGSPVFLRSGRGSRIIDEDGRTYIDYCLSWGPLILGHAHPRMLAAAAGAMRRGSTFGAPTRKETLLAEAIRRALPSMELMRFTSSGTEAAMSALRVARAATGRELVVKFAGCYHGHVDSLLVSAGSGALALGRPDSAGVPPAWARTTLTLPYNDSDAVVRAFARWGDRIAAVLVEPVAGNMGVVPPRPGFLEGLRKETRRRGALLIFDEVITGFRLCYGGAQTLWGVRPDLSILGKIVGGGFPLGAYGGRAELMRLVAPLGPVYQAGTLSGNPVAVAAGLKTLDLLRRGNPYAGLEEKARALVDSLREVSANCGVAAQIQGLGSMFTVFFASEPVRDLRQAKRADTAAYARFFHAMLRAGIYFPPSQFEAAFLSAAHTWKDVEDTIAAAKSAFRSATGPGRRDL